MKAYTLTLLGAVIFVAPALAQYNPFVYGQADVTTRGYFPEANLVGQSTPEISNSYVTLFGPQTVTVAPAGGNTVNMGTFRATVNRANALGLGGSVDFSTASYSGTFQEPDPAIDMSGGNHFKTLEVNYGTGSISVTDGPMHYVEGQGDAGALYRGRGTGLSNEFQFSDFSGPQPDVSDQRFLEINAANRLGGATSWDLDFDTADKITLFGFNYLMYNNFQSNNAELNISITDLPNIRVTAAFSGGSVLEAVQFTGENSNTIFFGFEAPEGEYLDSLSFFSVGVTWRVWASVADVGFAVEGMELVPEPSSLAMALTGFGAIALLLRRRR